MTKHTINIILLSLGIAIKNIIMLCLFNIKDHQSHVSHESPLYSFFERSIKRTPFYLTVLCSKNWNGRLHKVQPPYSKFFGLHLHNSKLIPFSFMENSKG